MSAPSPSSVEAEAAAGLDPQLRPTTELIALCPSCGVPLPLRVMRVEVEAGWPSVVKATVSAEISHACNRRSRVRT